jgi:hypothetical protein
VVILLSFSCFGSFTGEFHPIFNAPMLGAHKTDGANPRPFGTSVMPPADPASRAGAMPEASADSSSGKLGKQMRPHLLSLFLLSSTSCLLGQDRPSYFIIDAPGPAYQEFYKGMRIWPPPERRNYADLRLPFDPKSVINATLRDAELGQGQICLTFEPTKSEEVRRFVQDNTGKKILVELGDYILPVDFGHTLPWRGKVLTQPRPIEKARVILDSFNKQNKS